MNSLAVPALLICNHLVNPLGLHDPAPALSWQLAAPADERGVRQTAYRVVVSSQPNGPANLWDSGRIASDQSLHVRYAGKPLASRTRAYWQVTSWDQNNRATTSEPGSFWEMGLLERSDWKGRWIGAPWYGSGQEGASAPYLRRPFELRGQPVQARLYVTALGLYEAYLNGQRIGGDVFTPGWTDYRKRVQYQVYDVTSHLAAGENVLGAILGDGWYCGHVAQQGRQTYGDRPRLLAQLEISYSDGSSELIVSDAHWSVASGPILENDFLMGETYDARQEIANWHRPGVSGPEWRPAVEFPDPGVDLSPTLTPPVQQYESLAPQGPPTRHGGWNTDTYVYDFGQNLVGTVTLRVKAPKGTTIRLRFAEMLKPDGGLYVENLRSARATDYYTCKGDPAGETWTPKFTFHGFRYAELSGLPKEHPPAADALVAHVLHSGMESTGDFSCSDPLINQLQKNIRWGQRGNYLEVPTDCPQRDERLGWTGDAQAFVRTAAWNYDVAAFYSKWLRDLVDAQQPSGAVPAVIPALELVPGDGGPAWADATLICPWTVYRVYGDKTLLERLYPAMQRYVEFIGEQSKEDIRLHPDLDRWAGFGDWLALDGSGHTDGGTPKDLIGTAFAAHGAKLLAEMADTLARADDAARYRELAQRYIAAFQRRFVTQDGLVAGNTQTSYVLALHFDLVPAELRPRLVEQLVRDIRRRGTKLSTGFVGTPYLLHVLSREGQLDLAYELLHQEQWPSWLYAVTQGATTIWERWDGWTKEKGFQDPGMNSFNHYAYGAVGDWLYQVVAGIDLDDRHPAYKHLRLQPRPGGKLTSAKGRLRSPYGEIVSDWKQTDGRFEWDVVVPPNTTATARIPVADAAGVTESGTALVQAKGVSNVRVEDGAVWCELVSGSYRFHAGYPIPATRL